MALLGYMVQNGLANIDWIQANTTGYERILNQLKEADVEACAAFSGINMTLIIQAAEALASTDKIGVYEDLGIEMAPLHLMYLPEHADFSYSWQFW